MNRIIVALFRPGKRLPRSPGRHGGAALAACSQPAPPSCLGGLLCAPPAASPITGPSMPMCPLPLALCGPFPPLCRVLEATQDQLLSLRVPWAPYSTEFLHPRSVICKFPQCRGARPLAEGGRDMGKKCSGRSWQIPVESMVGTGAFNPIVLAFPAPLPSPPSRECSMADSAKSSLLGWRRVGDKSAVLQRSLCPSLLVVVCPAPWCYQAVPAGLER